VADPARHAVCRLGHRFPVGAASNPGAWMT
jgi:hypothetical protein